MQAIYGMQNWNRQYGASEAAKEWTLVLNKLTDTQVHEGLQQCRASGSDWPPSTARFFGMCQHNQKSDAWEGVLGYLNGEFPENQAAWHIVQKIGHFEITHMSRSRLERRFEDEWSRINFNNLMPWPEQSGAPELEHKQPEPAKPETRDANIAEIKKIIGDSPYG